MHKRIALYLSFIVPYVLWGALVGITLSVYITDPAQTTGIIALALSACVIAVWIIYSAIHNDYHRALYTHHLILQDRRKERIK